MTAPNIFQRRHCRRSPVQFLLSQRCFVRFKESASVWNGALTTMTETLIKVTSTSTDCTTNIWWRTKRWTVLLLFTTWPRWYPLCRYNTPSPKHWKTRQIDYRKLLWIWKWPGCMVEKISELRYHVRQNLHTIVQGRFWEVQDGHNKFIWLWREIGQSGPIASGHHFSVVQNFDKLV